MKYSLEMFDVCDVITLLSSVVIPDFQMTGQGNLQSSHRNQGQVPKYFSSALSILLVHSDGKGGLVPD